MRPVSIFIMDVSKSSAVSSGEELSAYLSEIEKYIKRWFQDYDSIQISHRSGDELIFLANGFSTAFVTAFFITRLWKFENNQPYFGLAFGSMSQSVESIEIEKWVHPLANLARIANDSLKNDHKSRGSFLFQTALSPRVQGLEFTTAEIGTLLNGMLKLQQALKDQQTDIQRLVCSLYSVYKRQNVVSEFLGRSAPTIYSHFKKGHCELILNSYREIADVLDSLQSKQFADSTSNRSEMLESRIRNHIMDEVNQIFPR